MSVSVAYGQGAQGEAARLYLDLLKRNLVRWNEVKIVPLSGKGLFRRAVRSAFAARGLEICQIKPFIAAQRETGRDWADGPTVVGLRRLDNIQQCMETVLREGVPGDMVDAGLWRGGPSILMRAVLAARGDAERCVWCADLPWEAGSGEVAYPAVPYRTPHLDVVKANFERYAMLDGRVKFVVGPFAATLAAAPIGRVAVLRLDTDTLEATREVLGALYAKVSPGGFVIVNDYGQGRETRRAVDGFRDAHQVRATVVDVDGTGAYWRVPARDQEAA